MSKQMDVGRFLTDVTNHKMAILLNNGVYRHLRFSQSKDSNMWFEIITWPECLTINGDMGTWSFSRVEDMFTFFRTGLRSGQLKINASYWGEKITSESRHGGPHEKFNTDTYKKNAIYSLDGYGLDDQRKAEIIEALELEVFGGDEDESCMRRALLSFEHGDFQFSDAWEIDGDSYTYHYLWCLYAIVWGIQQYDASADKQPEGAKL